MSTVLSLMRAGALIACCTESLSHYSRLPCTLGPTGRGCLESWRTLLLPLHEVLLLCQVGAHTHTLGVTGRGIHRRAASAPVRGEPGHGGGARGRGAAVRGCTLDIKSNNNLALSSDRSHHQKPHKTYYLWISLDVSILPFQQTQCTSPAGSWGATRRERAWRSWSWRLSWSTRSSSGRSFTPRWGVMPYCQGLRLILILALLILLNASCCR